MGNFIHSQPTVSRVTTRCGVILFFLSGACWGLAGCSDNVRRPTAAELAGFALDGPTGPAVDITQINQARMPSGPYRVVPGDVVQVAMPGMLDPQAGQAGAAGNAASQTYMCRVRDDGTITLPVVGSISVEGKSLSEIELAIIAAYYPKYVKVSVPVYVSVVEYKTHRVSIVGAVAKPGIYSLRHDQMSLVALLMEAGNIVDNGAAMIEITHTGTRDREVHGAPMPLRSNARNLVGSNPPARVIFECEGPLRTTGWLSVERPDEPPVRSWLDLGNEPQTQAFLQRAAGHAAGRQTRAIETRLLHLAAHLESARLQGDPGAGVENVGWQALDRGRFETALEQPRSFQETPRESATDQTDEGTTPAHVLLPVKGLNMPFTDVALQEGDAVTVQRPREQSVAVVGLVNRPGNMPYPLDVRHTLIEAIAFAGGLDLVADPRYVSVYRLQADGTVRSVTVRLVNPRKQEELTQAMSMVLRPGDVVSVENTLRTRMNVFFDRVFRVNLGLYISGDSLLNND